MHADTKCMFASGACHLLCSLHADMLYHHSVAGEACFKRRIFLKRLRDVLRIPVLALVDADPYGLKILSVYMKGALRGLCLHARAYHNCTQQADYAWCVAGLYMHFMSDFAAA